MNSYDAVTAPQAHRRLMRWLPSLLLWSLIVAAPVQAKETSDKADESESASASASQPHKKKSRKKRAASSESLRTTDTKVVFGMGRRFVYEASGRALSEVLRDFGAALGVPVIVSDGVEGKVQGQFDTEPGKFLDALAQSFGLIWYYDGSGLYVYSAKQLQSRLFRIQGYSAKQVTDLQRKLQVLDARFPVRYSADDGTLLVSGPPRHVEIISQLVESLDISTANGLMQRVELVELRHATAVDRKIGDTQVAGIVSTLQKMFARPEAAALAPSDDALASHAPTALASKMAEAQRNASLSDILSGKTMSDADAVGRSARPSGRSQRALASPMDRAEPPIFQVAPVGNAVVIVADALRMPMYVAAVRKMDIAPLLVELEVMIVDVDTDQLEKLGLSWSVYLGGSGGLPSNGVSMTPPQSVGEPVLRLAMGAFDRRLSVSLQALSSQGQAKLVTQSKVVAMASQTATLGEMRRAMVKVAAYQDAKLYPIESGTRIMVTPQVDRGGSTYRIRMMLDIEDGGFETTQVDGIPVARQTRIATEARVLDGESVLLAGLSTDRTSRTQAGVPGLSRLPFLGALFRSSDEQHKRNERLFLITPRVIHPIDKLSQVREEAKND